MADERPAGAGTVVLLGEPEMKPVRFVVPLEALGGFSTWNQAADARDVHIQYLAAAVP